MSPNLRCSPSHCPASEACKDRQDRAAARQRRLASDRSLEFPGRALALRSTIPLLAALGLLAPAAMAATYTVTNTNDSGPGSLREAITLANATDEHDTIGFNAGFGYITISLATALPALTKPVTIDGTTQTGLGPAPRVRIDASGTPSGNVLRLEAPACIAPTCVIRGLALTGAKTDGVRIVSGNWSLRTNQIGTDGSVALANAGAGIHVAGGNSVIGGGGVGEGNVISGNTGPGIYLSGTGTVVQGNRIGTNSAGSAAIANGSHGIRVFGSGHWIGWLVAAEGNLISGNGQSGIHLEGSSSGVSIFNNRIGTNLAGNAAVPNVLRGIAVAGNGHVIGASDVGNLISGNLSTAVAFLAATDGVRVSGNRIGTNAAGTAALGNAGHGITLGAGTNLEIGGAAAGLGNVISGNGGLGMWLSGTLGNDVRVFGNRIGTDPGGTSAMPNQGGGVLLASKGAIRFGGGGSGEGNVISGNTGNGIALNSATEQVHLKGNLIGTNAAGTAALGNSGYGIRATGGSSLQIGGSGPGEGNVISGNTLRNVALEGGVNGAVVEGNRVGPNLAGTAGISPNTGGIDIGGRNITLRNNQVSGNANGGVGINGADVENVLLVGNLVGTNAAGTGALPNGSTGIRVLSGAGIVIGGNAAADANTISGNTLRNLTLEGETDGVLVVGNRIGPNLAGTAGISPNTGGIDIGGRNLTIRNNQISGNANGGIGISGDVDNLIIIGNRIGTDPTGALAVPNGSYGIRAISGANVRIGGTAAGEGNLISGNVRGVSIEEGMVDTLIQGNTIGLNAARNAKLANTDWDGLDIAGQGTVVGGNTAAAANVIAGNQYSGIWVREAGSGAVIQGNFIGTNPAGAAGLGNRLAGVYLDRAHGVLVGGAGPGEGNLIAHNGFNGIFVPRGDGNSFLGNRIRDNALLDIELDPRGPQPNDAMDADGGPNFGQNYPLITSALANGSQVLVEGLLHSAPLQTYLIEISHSPACSPTGMGGGVNPLGFFSVETDAGGNASFSTSLALNTMSGVVTALATAPDGSTSEFSPCHGLTGPNPGTLQFWRNPELTWEGLPHIEIGVVRSMGSAGTVTVQFDTLNDSAIAPADYQAVSELLTFEDGEVYKTIQVPIVADNITEDQEQFLVRLSNPTGGATLGGQAQVPAIIIDVGADFPMYFVDDVTANEPLQGQREFVFTVSLTPTDQERIISYQTQAATAEAGLDFTPVSGELVFPPSDQTQSQTVSVPVLADAEVEPNEVFYLDVSAVGGGNIAVFRGTGIGTIRDADPSELPLPDAIFRNGFED